MIHVPKFAFPQVYNITTYTSDDGLMQSQVRAMLEGSLGYLWFGTHRGISRFDGKQFVNFGAKEGLKGNFVAALYESAKGDLWLGTDQGVSKFNGQDFIDFSLNDQSRSHQVEAITEDEKGIIWIGTQNKGLFHLDPSNDSLYVSPFSQQIGSENVTVYAFLREAPDHIWIGTNLGLFEYVGGKLRKFRLPLSEIEIFSLLRDKRGQLWVGTDKGIFIASQGGFQQFTEAEGLPDELVYCLAEDDEGKVWIGTALGGVYFDKGEIRNLGKRGKSLARRMRSALADEEGNIWFGTDGGGVRKITRGIFQRFSIEEDLSSDIAKSFLEDEYGRMWISTTDQGINVLDGENIVQNYTREDGLAGNDICYTYKDSKGNFWFGTYSAGLSRFDGKGFQTLTMEEGLPSNVVYAFTEDNKGNVWIGTSNGIAIWDGKTIKNFEKNAELDDKVIYFLAEDSQERMWVGGRKGVSYLENGAIRTFGQGNVGNTVINIQEDHNGRIWMASSGGIYVYEEETFTRVSISEASGANNVVSMVFDGKESLWIGTENGAYRLDLSKFDLERARSGQKIRFEHYTQKDGLPSLECNANAAFLDITGNVWLGTVGGAVRKPVGIFRVQENSPIRVHVTGIRTAMEGSWKENGFEVEPKTGLPKDLFLPSNANQVEISYIGISLKSPRQVEYRYKLLGSGNNDWSRPTRQTSLTFSNLSPGKYVFQIIAKKESEPWVYTDPTEYPFGINPAFYQSWWFRMLAALFLIGIIYAVFYQVTAEKRRKEKELSIRNEAERLQLEHQALYAMMNPHFTFNALQSIQYFIHQQDKKTANKFLSSFAKLVRKNLESTRSEFISLDEEMERLRLYLSLEKMRFPEKFDYEIQVDSSIDGADIQLPAMILQPFVENSIKHGIMPLEKDGQVSVDVIQPEEDFLKILIRDNGIGIEASKKRRADRPNDHVSHGMRITEDRLNLFGRITHKPHSINITEIKDEDGHRVKGTQVEIILPVHFYGEEILAV